MALMSGWGISSSICANISRGFMSGSNPAWNSWCAPLAKDGQQRPENASQNSPRDSSGLVDKSDRWIWGVWIVVALIAVAILPFATRLQEVAVAIASFCGIALG
jgi:hypothetical protein